MKLEASRAVGLFHPNVVSGMSEGVCRKCSVVLLLKPEAMAREVENQRHPRLKII